MMVVGWSGLSNEGMVLSKTRFGLVALLSVLFTTILLLAVTTDLVMNVDEFSNIQNSDRPNFCNSTQTYFRSSQHSSSNITDLN